MTPRVYITQESPRFNYTPAERFGEVRFLTANDISPIANSLLNAQTIAAVRTQLSDFNADIDYLAPSGSPIITGIAMAILHERFDNFRVLRWSNVDREYVVVSVSLR